VHTHTHTHTTVLRPCWILSGTTWLSREPASTRKVKPVWIYWSKRQWHQLGHMRICTLIRTHNHASIQPLRFLQAGCPFCCPTNNVKALKAKCICSAVHCISPHMFYWPPMSVYVVHISSVVFMYSIHILCACAVHIVCRKSMDTKLFGISRTLLAYA